MYLQPLEILDLVYLGLIYPISLFGDTVVEVESTKKMRCDLVRPQGQKEEARRG